MAKMKKGILVGLTVFIIGAVIFVVSMSFLDWDFYRLDNVTYTEKTFVASSGETDEKITDVRLDVNSFKVEVKAGDELKLDYYEASDSDTALTCENGVLKVSEKRKISWLFNMFNIGRLKYKYVLTLPAGVALSIESTNTDLSLSGIETDTVKVKATNCDIIMRNCTLNSLDVSSTNSDVEITDTECDSLKIVSTNLDLLVKNSQIQNLTLDGTNIDADIFDTVVQKATIDGTNLNCDLQRITVSKLSMDGTNVDADITVKGVRSQYTVRSHGRGGPSNQTGTAEGKELVFDGVNLDIDLRFV